MSNQMLINQVLMKPSLTFDNFYTNSNEELVEIIKNKLPTLILIWGEEASGKSHLLSAMKEKFGGEFFSSNTFPSTSADINTDLKKYFIDDINLFSNAQLDVLFYLFTKLQIAGLGDRDVNIAITSNCPPTQLKIREDLRNRLGWGLVYEIKRLPDSFARKALIERAKEMGWNLPEEVLSWLYSYYSRDAKFLFNLIDNLDQISLTEKRTITTPFVKRVIEDMASSNI